MSIIKQNNDELYESGKRMRKARILHFELDSNLGGIESFLLNLYKEIDRDAVQFDFVTQSDTPALADEFLSLDANIYKVSSAKNVCRYQHDIQKLLLNGYDVVHVHKNSLANIVPIYCGVKADIPVFLHSHNTKPSMGKITYLLHEINKFKAYKMTEEHFACSSEAGHWMYGNKSFTIARNGIIAEHFKFEHSKRIEKRKELLIPEDAFVIGHVGRFTDQKNHEFLLDIFNEVNRMKEETILLLIGEGENRNKIERKAKKLGINDKVKFLGNRSDIPQLLMCMDAFVMPSLYEGLPISAVEAQAAGVKTFLANTISKETELSSAVIWFSIDDKAYNIAKIIIEKCKEQSDRSWYNTEVVNAGFAMEKTAKMLQNTYINAMMKK